MTTDRTAGLLVFEASWTAMASALAALPAHIVVAHADGRLSCDTATATDLLSLVEGALLDSRAWLSDAAPIFHDAIRRAPNLRWVQSASSGFDAPFLRELADRGVAVSRTTVQSLGIAEFVMARLLSLFQREPERHALQAARDWRALPFREIHGTRWLIVGFGTIGRDIAIRAKAFGAEIVGMRRDPSPDPAADRIAHPERLSDELAGADVVVLALPLSDATRHMIDAAALAATKPDAVLINVGRGGLVDHYALIAALDAGRPAHAILDVAPLEPLPADDPLWSHPRVWMTAHASAYGDGLGNRADRFALDNIRRFLVDGTPLNLVGARD
ncbi:MULTISPECIES: D-2-hydroxyacid dehydrogenase [unclassified Sphingomonas]|uniref:D-2-hydroxyacid dehydrogenase n=1 Tax=unclassified Sphingomonas TaxID=196159 RepID=UPI0007023C80|nr:MULTISPECIES: D-2-hydroxyacid dehydrogenase [unclassified Sphingomonas]KQX23453.1 hypothetical protein ASD17_03905 [Sphingomonas sp. Root1294]KRB91203.1 hypothetical protein ASE22_13230 [Sphingomonas sp. Root720]